MLARLLNYVFDVKGMEANSVVLAMMFGNVSGSLSNNHSVITPDGACTDHT